MRYRPLGNTGMSVSAMSLVLSDSVRLREAEWVALIYAALESGINAFEITGSQPALIDGVGQALQAIDRRLVFLAWRLGYIDAAILDDPHSDEFSPPALDMLRRLKDMGSLHLLGVTGRDDAMDAYISSGAFDLVATPFSLMSGWKERLRVKAAIDRDMVVLGHDYYPDAVREPQQQEAAKAGNWARTAAKALSGVGTYAFLDRTPHWSGEEICLAYAMTEPSLCTVQVPADRIDRIELMAAVCERELPSGVPAQIEMARFSPPPPAEQTARRA